MCERFKAPERAAYCAYERSDKMRGDIVSEQLNLLSFRMRAVYTVPFVCNFLFGSRRPKEERADCGKRKVQLHTPKRVQQ